MSVKTRFTFNALISGDITPTDVVAAAIASVDAHNIVTGHRAKLVAPGIACISIDADVANKAEFPAILRDIRRDTNSLVDGFDAERADVRG